MYKFHPFEIGFSGNSGTGKTTLIEKLVKKLSQNYSIAFIKHDIHGFEIDKKGKDTYRIYGAGADAVYISDNNHRAYISKKELNSDLFKEELLLYDFAVIEGYKKENFNKYLLWEDLDKNNIPNLEKNENIKGIILKNYKNFISGIKVFDRNDIDGIYADFLKNLENMKPDLNALILVGGKSSRMGEDKGLINYNGTKQVDYLYNLLKPFVNEVIVSVNSNQKTLSEYSKFNTVVDKINETGPLGGILSAFIEDKSKAYLVVACDLPLVDENVIVSILKNRDFLKFGTFFDSEYGFEPLIGIYEPKSFPFLLKSLYKGRYGIKNTLKKLPLNIVENTFKNKLKNINTAIDKENFFKNF